MGTITIKNLKTEGRLSKGDMLQSSELGVCRVAYIVDVRTICVVDAHGAYHRLTVNFGADTRIEGE